MTSRDALVDLIAAALLAGHYPVNRDMAWTQAEDVVDALKKEGLA